MSEDNTNEPTEVEVADAPAPLGAAVPPPMPQTPKPYISREVTVSDDTSPAGLLAVAVARGASVEELDKLLALKERFDAAEARKAYTAAMAQFKQDAPMIFKDKKVAYENKDGTTTGYSHATLGNVANVIASSLGEYGLSHGWSMQQQDSLIKVTCTITHELGHSESASLQASADGSGGKNPIQAVASTVTYLERYTLLAITGMAAQEGDDDGDLGGTELITEEQAAELQAIAETIKDFNAAFFFKTMKCESLETLPAKRFKQAKKVLEVKANAGN